jgi:uncharacterized protein (TIGR03437 family)
MYLRQLLAGIFVCSLAGAQEMDRAATKPKEDDDRVRERMEDFYRQRAYPDQRITPGARLNSYHELLNTESAAATGKLKPRGAGFTDQWKFIGPQPTLSGSGASQYVTSGRVTAIAVDPRSNDTIYIGGADGGIWKTTDGGTTWTPLTDQQPSLSTGSIAIDPANPDTVYVGTGEQNNNGDAYTGVGILKSIDGGKTWANLPGPFVNTHVGALAVHPTDGKTVFAASRIGLFRSTDAGQTWSRILPTPPTVAALASSVFIDPRQPTVVWAALGQDDGNAQNGVYKSTDGGDTWALSRGTAPGGSIPSGVNVGRIEISNVATSPNSVIAAVPNRYQSSTGASTLNDIYLTTDGGTTWKALGAPDFCSPQCWYDITIRPSPTDPNVIFVGGVRMFRSLNGGTTFTALPSNGSQGSPHVDNHAMQFSNDGKRFYNGNDGGMWSTDAFTGPNIVWNNLNATLALTQYEPSVAIHPTDVNTTLAGTQDNGSHLYQGQLEWNQLIGGDGGWAAIDQASPNYAFTEFFDISLVRYINFPLTNFAPYDATHGINQNDRVSFYAPYVLDPTNPQRMYYGTQFLYKSVDGGGLWLPISPDLTRGSSVLRAIAVAPTDPNRLYTGAGSGSVYTSPDGGTTWTDRTAGLPLRSVTQIAVDPIDPQTVYVSLSGTSTTVNPAGHIFKSTNAGANWTSVSGNLPLGLPVDEIIIDPDSPNTLYIGTDLGVMYTTDDGTTWQTLGSNLPRVAVIGMNLHRPTRVLRAGTHGRSMWDYQLAAVTSLRPTISSLSPATANAGGGAFDLTITGNGFAQGFKVFWNGSERPVTSTSATTIVARIPATDIQGVGRAAVIVFNPTRGGGSSAPANFPIGPNPSINTGGIVSSAFSGTATGAPGGLMSIYGANFTGALVQAVQFPLPTSLGNVTMAVGNFYAPIYFVSPGQINFQIPFSTPNGNNSVQVLQGTNRIVANLTIVTASPALFSTNQQGSGQGAIRIANTATIAAPVGSIKGADCKPVARGGFIEIYGTGLGAVTPSVVTGDVPTSLSKTRLTPTVTVGGVQATVAFSGLNPGAAGLYQVNVQIPPDAPTGDAVPVVVTINGVQSNTVTIAVQ